MSQYEVDVALLDEQLYPCTVVPSRYGGGYEGEVGDSWLAFPLPPWQVPREAFGSDAPCVTWFGENDSQPIGRGSSASAAHDDLLRRLLEVDPAAQGPKINQPRWSIGWSDLPSY